MNASYLTHAAPSGLTTLARQAYLSYKGLFLWLNWPAYVSNVVLRPGLIVAMYALTGRFARGEGAVEVYVIGLTAYAVPSIVMGGVLQGFYYERSFGTISFYFASCGNRVASYFARGALHLPNAALVVVAALGFSALFLHTSFDDANWGAVVACYLVMALAATACALCWANLCIVLRDWLLLYSLMLSVFLVCTGVVIPRDELPLGLDIAGAALPVTHALGGLREAYGGAGIGAITGDLALEALVGVAYAALGYALFRGVEAHARRSGAYAAF
ncbi:MAG TPA: ABC transporter permease [Dehalococcoidia bacterium]|nr:ABC transporter permease [Dehalococcoidia bacterium]